MDAHGPSGRLHSSREAVIFLQISGDIARKWCILLVRYRDAQTSPRGAFGGSFLTLPVVPWVLDWTGAVGEESDILPEICRFSQRD